MQVSTGDRHRFASAVTWIKPMPMQVVAIQKATQHLESAREQIPRLTLAKGHRAFETAWTEFLAQVSRFYSKMEQGSKGCGKSEAWFGRKKHERKKDPLLSYLHHARDSEEHGVDFITEIKADKAQMQATADGKLHAKFWFKKNADGTLSFREPTVNAGKVMFLNPTVILATIHDRRFGDSFEPPKAHLNKPIDDTSPQGIANLAVTYLEEFLAQAKRLPFRYPAQIKGRD